MRLMVSSTSACWTDGTVVDMLMTADAHSRVTIDDRLMETMTTGEYLCDGGGAMESNRRGG